MEKGNGKTIAVVSLVVAVFALAVGFATFSANLTIDNGAATVVPADTFASNIKWSDTQGDEPTCSVNTGSSAGATVSSPGSYSNNTSWTGISLKLREPGDSITCTGKMKNASSFTAYLRSIVSSGNNSGMLQCTAASSAVDGISPATNAAEVCPYLKVEVKAANVAATNTEITYNAAANNAFSGSGNAQSVAAGSTQDVTVTLTYVSTNAVLANGAISVVIPTITLNYQTDAGSSS